MKLKSILCLGGFALMASSAFAEEASTAEMPKVEKAAAETIELHVVMMKGGG